MKTKFSWNFKSTKILSYVKVLPVCALIRVSFYDDLARIISLQRVRRPSGIWPPPEREYRRRAYACGMDNEMIVLVSRFPHGSPGSGEETSKVARMSLILSSMLVLRHFSAVARYCFSAAVGVLPERRMRSPRTMACNWSTDCSRRSLIRM